MAFLKGTNTGGLSGKLGTRVYRWVGGDTVVATLPVKNDPRTPLQLEGRRHFERAALLWGTLPLDAIARWRAYGEATGVRGDLAFRGLAGKYMQIHGSVEVPSEPPASAFLGDGLVVSVTVETPSPTVPSSGVLFAASFPNTPGVLTELLLQRLPARHRKPKPNDYRTQAFVAFAGGPVLVPARVGAYACAVKFVRADTAQSTALVPLGVVEVAG